MFIYAILCAEYRGIINFKQKPNSMGATIMRQQIRSLEHLKHEFSTNPRDTYSKYLVILQPNVTLGSFWTISSILFI